MPDKHALLSASSSHRWLQCPPCAKLELEFPNRTSQYAEEGTLAHELGEISLKKELGIITEKQYSDRLKKIVANGMYSKDMTDYVARYIETCMERYNTAKAKTPDAEAMVEQHLDFSKWVPDGFGTGDFVTVADGTMEICDLKYGKGVPVSADHNPQMMLYALGAISAFEFLYDIKNVRMTIIQPRLDSISTYEVTTEELMYWAEFTVKPVAKLAIEGKGEFKAGEHCGFCRAKSVCKERAKKNMELAQYEFRSTDTLSENDIADILKKIDELVKWAKDVKEYALDQALQGVKYDGFKVVEGRSSRKYSDEPSIIETLKANGYKDIFKPQELLTLTNMEKLVGKKKLNELIGQYIVKPAGAPTLAPADDKRPEYNTAAADFLGE